jgi:hypothetical protein
MTTKRKINPVLLSTLAICGWGERPSVTAEAAAKVEEEMHPLVDPPKFKPSLMNAITQNALSQAVKGVESAVRKINHRASVVGKDSLLTRIQSAATIQELKTLTDERQKYVKASMKTHRRWVGAIGERYKVLTEGK